MSKTRHIFFFFFFTLAFFTARGQFAAKDRLLSGGFNVNYTHQVGIVSAQTVQIFDVGIKPQMSIFLSPHFSMGLGLDMSFSHEKWVTNSVNKDKYLTNRIQTTPQLIAQYYRPFAEKWYAAIRFDLKPIDLELRKWFSSYAGQSFESKYMFNSTIGLNTSFTPLIGYRASKHWLIEGELGVLRISANKKTTDSATHSYISVNGQFRSSLFDFKAIYLWQKKAPSVSKSK